MTKKFRSFEEARKFVHSLELKNWKDWREYCKSGKKPEDIPNYPNEAYATKGWKNMGDWLGTGTIAPQIKAKNWRSFQNARKFARSLNLKNNDEWRSFVTSKDRPVDLPVNPDRIYKDKGWISWGNWLGTGTIAPYYRKFREFNEAKKFVHFLGIKGQSDWIQYCKLNKKPEDIPRSPNQVYKNKGWTSWGDWFGTGTIAANLRQYRSFAEAREFAQSLSLKAQKEWFTLSTSKKLPKDIPYNPASTYLRKGWKSWGDFLGTGNISSKMKSKNWRSFEAARKYARSLGLSGNNEWRKIIKSGNLLSDIPTKPDEVYRNKGWKSWGDWFGTGIVATYKLEFRNFKEAREFVRSLKLESNIGWREFIKSKDVPTDIPTSPDKTYKKEWTSWGDWLGTGTIAFNKTQWLPFQEAKKEYQKLSRKYNIKGMADWTKFLQTHELPNGLPHSPWLVYSKENVLKRWKKK